MKVTIRNLGIINEAEIDLKPLTIFVGPNNSGKTWLAYLLSAIFSQEGWDQYTRALTTNLIQDTYPLLENAIQDILNKGNGSLDLVQFADEQGEIYINNVAHYTQNWLQKYMKTERVTFEGLEIQISIGETKQAFLEKVLDATLEEGLSIGLQRKKPLVSVRKENGMRELYFYTEGNTKGNILEALPLSSIKRFLMSSVFGVLHRAFYANTYVFPTERTAFISMPPRNVRALGVDHLANLMKAAEHQSQDTIREEFFLQQKEAFISKAKVSAYLVDQSKANNILGEDGLIYWDTFSDISDRVTRIYSKLL